MTLFPGVALVTGAGSGTYYSCLSLIKHIIFRFKKSHLLKITGIGRATVLAFVREGCKYIIFTDRDVAGLEKTGEMFEELKKEFPEIQGVWLVTDIGEEDKVENMVKECVGRWGRVDYAVNCAG